MKRELLFILSMALSMALFSQNDLVVFAEDGSAFTLFVNGEQINESPATRVKALDLTSEYAACRIIFAEDKAPELKQNIAFFEKDKEITARIVMTKRGYKLRPFGEGPRTGESLVDELIETPSQDVVDKEVVKVRTSPVIDSAPVTSTTTVKTVTMETVEAPAGEAKGGERVKMDMNFMGVNMGVDVQVEGDGMNMDSSVEGSSVTTTTTTTTTTMVSGADIEEMEEMEFESNGAFEEEVDLGVDGPCGPAMIDVSRIRSAVAAEGFDDEKMMVAKQALRNACLKTSAVKSLAELFSFEEDKLEFVKFCYTRTADPENYFDLYSLFSFSDSKEQLEQFLETR